MKNGVRSLAEMRNRIEHYRRTPGSHFEDYEIGCIMLSEPIFLDSRAEFELEGWSANTQVGRKYLLTESPGRAIWARLEALIQERPTPAFSLQQPTPARYGAPMFVRPRLGQGSFQAAVRGAYGRRCAVTGEKVIPTLEAAHIRAYSEGGEHRVDNGLLLRRDIHALFDHGYITVTPELEVVVSHRLQTEYHNGDHYLALNGSALRVPADLLEAPSPDFLDWHNQHRFIA